MSNGKLFRVYRQGDRIFVAVANITSETDKTITIRSHEHPAAFNWRTRLSKERDLICRTPHEAIDAFIKQQQAVLERAQNELNRTHQLIEQAQALYSSASSGDNKATPPQSGVST